MPQAILNSYFAAPPPCEMIDTTSMTMWYKGYEGVLIGGIPPVDGGAVDQVENQISTTDAVQATVAAQPTWHANQVNGKGVIRFDGVNDFLQVAHGADTNFLAPSTFFFLVRVPNFTDYTMFLTKGTSGGVQQYSVYTLPAPFPGRIAYCHNTVCAEVDGLVAAQWERLVVRVTTGPTRVFIYRNGVELGMIGIPNPTSNAAPARIGLRVDNLGHAYDLLEMGTFSRAISVAEVSDLDCYLAGVAGA